MKNLLKKITPFILIIIISACSVNKRRYLSGYDISYKKSKVETKVNSKTSAVEKDSTINEAIKVLSINSNPSNKILASTNNCIEPALFIDKTPTINFQKLTDNCDNIIMRNSKEIKCIVSEIGISEIKYKKCDNLNGPIYTVDKNEVLMIQYANGTNEIIENKKNTNFNNKPDTSKSTYHPLAVAALICSTAGIFLYGIGLPLGLIFGAIAINKINKNPTKFKGSGMALAGMIIGPLLLLLLILIIILFILISL
jgi:hypothetical protein